MRGWYSFTLQECYTFIFHLTPPYLAGREDELLWFESSLNSALSFPQNLVLSN